MTVATDAKGQVGNTSEVKEGIIEEPDSVETHQVVALGDVDKERRLLFELLMNCCFS